MKRMLIWGLVAMLSLQAYAHNTQIEGKVQDEKGSPLVGANVVVDGTLLGVVTNGDGKFRLDVRDRESCVLIVSYLGYESQRLELRVPYENPYEVHLQASPFLAEEVVVVATRAGQKTPVAHVNMDKEAIVQQNMGQDMAYLLSLTPSLVQSSESGTGIGYTNFRIRGSDPSRINITVDGIPLNDAESQQVFWVNMPAFSSSLNSIQVQRGVGTSTNGAAAFGATVNLQTEAPSKKAYGEMASTFGSYKTLINTLKAGTGLIGQRFSLDMRYSKMKSEGYVDHATSDNQSMYFTGNYFLKKGRIKAKVILGEQHTGISWWGIDEATLDTNRTYNPAGQYIKPDGSPAYYKGQTDNYWQNHYHLVYTTELKEHLYLNAALFYVDGRGYYEQFKQDEDLAGYYLPPVSVGGDSVFSSDLIRQKWLDNDFYGGVFSLQYSKEKLRIYGGGGYNRYLGDHFGKITWMRFAGESEKGHEWYRNDAEKVDANAYVKAQYQLGERFSLFGDVQYRYVNYAMQGIDDDGYQRELSQEHTFHFVNPKVGVQVDLRPGQQAYASLSIGNREPTRQNFKDATGDPEAKPRAETLRDLELGYQYSSTWLAATANLYYMDYRQQLVPTGELSSDGYPIMTNVTGSYRAGIELMLGIQPTSFFQWNANLTLSQNKIRDFVESYVDYDSNTWEGVEMERELGEVDLAYSPSVIFSSDLGFTLPGEVQLHLISQYVSEQYFSNTENEDLRLDAWFVNKLRVSRFFDIPALGSLGLQLQVNNLFNALYENNAYGGTWWMDGTEYHWSAYFPQATTNFLGKVTLRF